MAENGNEWRKLVVQTSTTLIDTMKAITEGRQQFSVVLDGNDRLLGTVTDGDIRRAILNKVNVQETPVHEVMNETPHFAYQHESAETMVGRMREHNIRDLPVLDESGCVISIVHLDKLLQPKAPLENWVVIMAGGLGKRLRPLTEKTPKPMLPVGSKPLLETIIENFRRYNFRRFYFSVNYKAHLIREYFGNGDKLNTEIRYLEEKKKLGTAGSLRLIEERPDKPIIVMNGDLLTRVNFEALLDFHNQERGAATMCVREYDFQIPFGVVEIDRQQIQSIAEKPVHQFFVNAGIYILNPELFDLIPENEYFDMTTLFEKIIESDQKASVFPIKEYWLDVGRMDDLDMARLNYDDVFGT